MTAVVRKAVLVVLGLIAVRFLLPRALGREARMIALLGSLIRLMAVAATANTSKAYSTEARTAALESRTGQVELGNIINVQPSSTVGQLQEGTFINVNGSQVQITGAGGGDLYIVALKLWNDAVQVGYLNSIHPYHPSTTVPAAPTSYSQSWGDGMVNSLNEVRALLGSANIFN